MNDLRSKQMDIYRNLLIGIGQGPEPRKWANYKLCQAKGGVMGLHVDMLERGRDHVVVAIAHNYEANGDIIPDPDMMVRMYPDEHRAEPLSFQNSLVYTQVYDEDGNANEAAQRSLTDFLLGWSRTIAATYARPSM